MTFGSLSRTISSTDTKTETNQDIHFLCKYTGEEASKAIRLLQAAQCYISLAVRLWTEEQGSTNFSSDAG
eukprot:279712-Pleurochrysis_carterae.AAC.1